MPTTLHTTAQIDPTAELGENVEIGPFAVVGANTKVGDDCRILAHAVVHKGTTLGSGSMVDCHSVVGGDPNFIGFDTSIQSGVSIGEKATLREFTTIHRSTQEGGQTVIGNNFFLMPNAHVAHDCHIGDHVTMANASLLGGHVIVGSYAFFGGVSAVHQFCRIGEGVMVGGWAAISYDIAPYTTVANRNEIHGLNLVGLRRRNVNREAIYELKELYKAILQAQGKAEDLAAAISAPTHSEGQTFVNFFQGSHRGYAKSTRA